MAKAMASAWTRFVARLSAAFASRAFSADNGSLPIDPSWLPIDLSQLPRETI